MEKNLYFVQQEMLRMGLNSMHVGFGCANSNATGFEAVHSDVSKLWAICMHYIGECSS